MKKYLSLVAMAMLLTACGGGGGGGGYGNASQSPPPVALGDAFIAYVNTTASIVPETVEAATVDAVVATAPENNEPIPLS